MEKRKTPRIENMMKISRMTMVTLKIPLKDPRRELTMILRFLLCDINLNGLRILSILKIFKTSRFAPPPPSSNPRIISYSDARTIIKSSLFQETER